MSVPWYETRRVLTIVNTIAIVLLVPLIPVFFKAGDWLWVIISSLGLISSITWIVWGRPLTSVE